MLVRSEQNVFKVNKDILPLEVASQMCWEKLISEGRRSMEKPSVFNASSWIRCKHLFDRDIKVILDSPGFIRNLYLSLYLSN